MREMVEWGWRKGKGCEGNGGVGLEEGKGCEGNCGVGLDGERIRGGKGCKGGVHRRLRESDEE